MKIAYIEFGGSHMEIVNSFSHLLHKKGCEFHLICNEDILQNLPKKSIVDYVMTVPNQLKGRAQFKVFKDVRNYLKKNNIQHLIIGTTEIKVIRNFSFFVRDLNVTGVVHNVEKLEKRWTTLRLGFINIKKFIVLGRQLLVNAKPLKGYEISHLTPIYFPDIDKLNPIKNPDECWIVVPGGIEQLRRDYVALINQLGMSEPLKKIKFVFLGALWKEREVEVAEALGQMKVNRDNIVTFDGFLDYDLFHSYLKQADFVLPLYKMGDNDWYHDKRISGATPLGMSYRIPFLLPDSYKQNIDLNRYSLFYSSYDELINKVISLSVNKGNDEFSTVTTNYAEDYSNFNEDKVADKLYQFIEKK